MSAPPAGCYSFRPKFEPAPESQRGPGQPRLAVPGYCRDAKRPVISVQRNDIEIPEPRMRSAHGFFLALSALIDSAKRLLLEWRVCHSAFFASSSDLAFSTSTSSSLMRLGLV